jgi:hypothetical protein
MKKETLLTQFDYFNNHVSMLFDDPRTSLQEKITGLVCFYIDMIIEYLEVVSFVLNKAKSNPDELISKMKVVQDVNDSVMAMQILEITLKNGKNIHPQHFIMNIVSMCVFPLIVGNMIKKYGKLNTDTYNALMQERKALIALWAMGMMTKTPNYLNYIDMV